jgi:hypothetical protein
MNQAAFDQELHRIRKLQKALTAHDFWIDHENDVTEFLSTFCEHSSDPGYLRLAKELYFDFWMKRLRPFGRREWYVSATVEEFVRATDVSNHFAALLASIPAIGPIIGPSGLHRDLSKVKALDASLFQKWKRPDQAVRKFEEAAELLETIPDGGTQRDRANAAGNRARIAEIIAFTSLRKRPSPDLKGALIHFQEAARYLVRGRALLRQSGVPVTSQRVWYLRYWQHVAATGLLATNWSFEKAHRHSAAAYLYASKLPTFPRQRWYLDLDDLQNLSYILRSYEALIRDHDLPQCASLLDEWLRKSSSIQTSGRYLRIQLRSMVINILIAWDRERSQAKALAQTLERFVGGQRSLGCNEMYMRDTVRALLSGNQDNNKALDQIASVFVLDSEAPDEFFYLDVTEQIEKCFRVLPIVFSEWVAQRDPDKLAAEELSYILLLYIRSLAEFWAGVHDKRVIEGRVNAQIECPRPASFAETNWEELLTLLDALCRLFPALRALTQVTSQCREVLLNYLTKDRSLVDVEMYRDAVIKVICETERSLFPHPVLLKTFSSAERGRVDAHFLRAWAGTPHSFDLTVRLRLGQELVVGRYYFLKPAYKRCSTATEHEDLILYRASAFGEPCQMRVALLVEGKDDYAVFEKMLARLNPHWSARITIVLAEGASHFVHIYNDLQRARAYRAVVVAGDVVGSDRALDDLSRISQHVYRMDPDLEVSSLRPFRALC